MALEMGNGLDGYAEGGVGLDGGAGEKALGWSGLMSTLLGVTDSPFL